MTLCRIDVRGALRAVRILLCSAVGLTAGAGPATSPTAPNQPGAQLKLYISGPTLDRHVLAIPVVVELAMDAKRAESRSAALLTLNGSEFKSFTDHHKAPSIPPSIVADAYLVLEYANTQTTEQRSYVKEIIEPIRFVAVTPGTTFLKFSVYGPELMPGQVRLTAHYASNTGILCSSEPVYVPCVEGK